MRSAKLFVVGVALVCSATFVAACGGQSTPATPSDPVLAQGQQIYNANCSSCHGKGGGGGLGPKLAGVVAARFPDIADQEAVISQGRDQMPSFSKKLTADEINAVARYEREVLGQDKG